MKPINNWVSKDALIANEKEAYERGRKDEREAIFYAINALIKLGDLPGDGWDKTAERNGLILASNEVVKRDSYARLEQNRRRPGPFPTPTL